MEKNEIACSLALYKKGSTEEENIIFAGTAFDAHPIPKIGRILAFSIHLNKLQLLKSVRVSGGVLGLTQYRNMLAGLVTSTLVLFSVHTSSTSTPTLVIKEAVVYRSKKKHFIYFNRYHRKYHWNRRLNNLNLSQQI
eukprot:TRINITY_DN58174_c0_g1_i1.p1 TRINITY_DN58174_c0_g1~~TRINITY_DN58174_c0_g1_i1.p1  ORF type:complete len:137 (+),score=13.50 TRINITY_DN58174_c0_g1_i1:212-622(+)